jgi:hypothetical protein
MSKQVHNGSVAVIQRVISGRGIAHRQLDKRQRACLGADVADGVAVLQLSIRQLARLLGVCEQYIRAAQQLSPHKRGAILSGQDTTSFAVLLTPSEPTLALPAPKPVTDDDLAHLAHVVGADRWLHAAAEAGI